MHILIFCKTKIPALTYGGTPRDIVALGKVLTEKGHKVTFLVPEGSSNEFADVLFYNPAIPLNDQIPKDTDIVNLHSPINEEIDFPYLNAIHGNPQKGEKILTNSIFVSKNHANRYNSEHFVYNGIDWDLYPKPDLKQKRTNLHFLGKAAWKVKNLKGAMYIARKTSHRLDVMGGYRFNFKMGIRLTFDPRIKFHGMVDNNYKCTIMNKSKGLLFPVLWQEPMGLAVVESLYFGCPVFATPYGALPELVGKEFGFLSNNANDLAGAVNNSDVFSPQKCHEYARDTFNPQKMTEGYLAYFERILNGETLSPASPTMDESIKTFGQDFFYD